MKLNVLYSHLISGKMSLCLRMFCGSKARNMIIRSQAKGLPVEFQGTHYPQLITIFLFVIATCKNTPLSLAATQDFCISSKSEKWDKTVVNSLLNFLHIISFLTEKDIKSLFHHFLELFSKGHEGHIFMWLRNICQKTLFMRN